MSEMDAEKTGWDKMTFDFFMTLDRSDIRLANEFNIFDNVSDLESFCVEDEISTRRTHRPSAMESHKESTRNWCLVPLVFLFQNILFLLFLVFSSVALSNFKFPNEAQQGTIFLNIERYKDSGLKSFVKSPSG
jgi:hypothetical protein